MPRRLSEKENKELVKGFKNGKTVQLLSEEFNFSNVTIIKKLKKNLGISVYKELNSINKKSAETNYFKRKEILNKDNDENNPIEESKDENNFPQVSEFMEITPLNYEIENSPRKELSSVPISQIDFPKILYMIVNKNIELEIKPLKDYPEWDFLPNSDLNRKTIEVYDDIKVAKRFCNKEQKVIKIPNTDVFRVVGPTLISRGISRIICSQQLIAL